MPKRKKKEDESDTHKEMGEEDNYEEDDFHEMYMNEEDLDEEEDYSLNEEESMGDVHEEEF